MSARNSTSIDGLFLSATYVCMNNPATRFPTRRRFNSPEFGLSRYGVHPIQFQYVLCFQKTVGRHIRLSSAPLILITWTCNARSEVCIFASRPLLEFDIHFLPLISACL